MTAGGVVKRAWTLIACVLAASCLLPDAARAQAGMTGTIVPVCVLPATPGMSPAQLLRNPKRFDCTTPQQHFGGGDFWAISGPIDSLSSDRTPLRVRFGSLYQGHVTLHILYADGALAALPLDGRAATRAMQLGAILELPVPVRAAPVRRLLWHIEDSANVRGILLGVRIATEDQSERSNLLMGSIYTAFGGLCVALLVYNLALWGALRHRFQLAYCLMVSALLAYTVTSSGALAWLLPGIENNFRIRLNYLALGWAGSAALLFARAFFEPRVFLGGVGRLTNIAIVALALAGLQFALLAPFAVRFADLTFSLAFVAIPIAAVPVLYRAWRTRSNYLWLFAIAWAAPLAMAVTRTLANLHLIPGGFWLDNSTILSMAAESLLSSLAIAYRMHLLSRERDEAVAAEAIAKRLAETDPLTGLLNRRAFLERAIGLSGEQMLLIADLDHFKQINETLGHDGGDEVLRRVARALRMSLPAGALIARFGGEEFAIVVDAKARIEPDTILDALRVTRMPFDLTVTASIGFSTGVLEAEPDWKRLYRLADTALFAAKSAGRDRVRRAVEREAA